MYLLDTKICFALLTGEPAVVKKFRREKEECYISTIVLAELCKAIHSTGNHKRYLEHLEILTSSLHLVEFDQYAAIEVGKIQWELNINRSSIEQLKVLIAAVARSRGDVVVTDKTRYFKFHCIQNLQLENWTNSLGNEFSCTVENKPGVLYKIAKALEELEINITKVGGNSIHNTQNPDTHNYFTMEVCLPSNVSIEDVHSRFVRLPDLSISNVRFEPDDSRVAFLTFKGGAHTHDINKASSRVSKQIQFRGKDRVGIVALVVHHLYSRRINIVNFEGHTSSDRETSSNSDITYFNILFALSSDSDQNWNEICEEINRSIDGGNAWYF